MNPDFVARLTAGDRSADSPTSPRQVLLAHYVKPPFVPAELDIYIESMLSTRLGDDHYPGTSRPVPPGRASHPATAHVDQPGHFLAALTEHLAQAQALTHSLATPAQRQSLVARALWVATQCDFGA